MTIRFLLSQALSSWRRSQRQHEEIAVLHSFRLVSAAQFNRSVFAMPFRKEETTVEIVANVSPSYRLAFQSGNTCV